MRDVNENNEPRRMINLDHERGIFEVRREAFVSDAIFNLEVERIFERGWVFVAHESEISKPGDFRTRNFMGRPIILSRGQDDKVRVFLNVCTHRGAILSRETVGCAKVFSCNYHGWKFSNTGKLIGVPSESSYGANFSKENFGLKEVASVDSYHGLIFVSLKTPKISLTEHLGESKKYIDEIFGLSRTGYETLPDSGSHRYAADANWKLLMENSLDWYHFPIAHKRAFESAEQVAPVDTSFPLGTGSPLEMGHDIIEIVRGHRNTPWYPNHPTLAGSARNLLIFPNLIINNMVSLNIRTYTPIRAGRTEIEQWALVPKESSDKEKRELVSTVTTFLSPAGMTMADDLELTESCQRGYSTYQEIEWSDMSRGFSNRSKRADDDYHLSTFWTHWEKLVI